MNNSAFLSKENVEMIWEIILDEDFMKKDINESEAVEIQKSFISEIKMFYQKEKGLNQGLMDMNKKFIENVLSNRQTLQIIEKTTNMNTTINSSINSTMHVPVSQKPLVTAEDIQSSRMNDFERQLSQKQNDFANAMTLKVPNRPNFNDEMDKPISAMEDLISRTLAQRNFDIEQIQKNINKDQVETFLKSQETSIKNEKQPMTQNKQSVPLYNVNNNDVKFIKIGSEDISIQLNDAIEISSPLNEKTDKKHISWADNENIKLNIETSVEPPIQSTNILSKLKLKPRENQETIVYKPDKSDIEIIYKKINELDEKMNEILLLLKNKIDIL